MTAKVIGLDIAKHVFQVHGADASGKAVLKKRLRREQMSEFFGSIPRCTVAMEATRGAHYWARVIGTFGHEVRLIAPQFVKPYVRGQKNECKMLLRSVRRKPARDAICSAEVDSATGPADVASDPKPAGGEPHASRESGPRTAGRVRHHCAVASESTAEAAGRAHKRIHVQLTPFAQELFVTLYEELCGAGRTHRRNGETHPAGLPKRRSLSKDCTGGRSRPVIATAIVAAIADGKAFRNGRQLSAWLGLVPRQHSSGDKQRLLGISKRGDPYLTHVTDSRCAFGRLPMRCQNGFAKPLDRRQTEKIRNHESLRCGGE